MGSIQSSQSRDAAGVTKERWISVAEANRALPLVSRIVSDLVTKYRELRELRRQRNALPRQGQGAPAEDLERRISEAAERLDEFVGELGELSVQPEDLEAGLVDFPGRRNGKAVLLCWKLGEPELRFWHDPHARFANRRPIDEACE